MGCDIGHNDLDVHRILMNDALEQPTGGEIMSNYIRQKFGVKE